MFGAHQLQRCGDLDASFTVNLGIVVPVTVGGSVNGDWALGGNLADFSNIAGDLNADVSADLIGHVAAYRLTIGGDVTANGSITSDTDLTESMVISIGGSLLGPISLGSGGLKGQVIVNSLNAQVRRTRCQRGRRGGAVPLRHLPGTLSRGGAIPRQPTASPSRAPAGA